MKRLQKTLLVCALALGLLLTVTGCNSGGNAGGNNTEPTKRTVSAPCGCTGEGAFTKSGGTITTPWLVSTPEQLDHMREHLDAYYRLEQDIDLLDYLEGSDSGWMPIGETKTNSFIGGFDGDGHSLTGLWINSGAEYVGFFGCTDNASISDLSIDIIATGTAVNDGSVGGLVGLNTNGAINNCKVTGSVTGGNYVGGLAGYNDDGGAITECYATGDVTGVGTGRNHVGGIAGWNRGVIGDCYTTGNITGVVVGGLAACNEFIIAASYSTSTVEGYGIEPIVGGLAGAMIDGQVYNCYATGIATATGEGAGVGGLVGFNDGGKIEYSYWNSDATESGLGGSSVNAVGTPIGMTLAEMCTESFCDTLNADKGNYGTWVQDDAKQGGLPHRALRQ